MQDVDGIRPLELVRILSAFRHNSKRGILLTELQHGREIMAKVLNVGQR